MGPAVTSEAVSCEREKRLRTTASLSPHNTHSDHLPTGMNPEGSGELTGCQSITSASSCQIVEPTAGVSACSSGPQFGQSVEDDRLSSLPGESLNLCNVNIVNLKDIHSRHKVSIFIKNNASRMLPNGGKTGHSMGSNEKITQNQVAATASCDGTVPCGTVESPHVVQTARLLNASQADNNGLSAASRVHHMIIIPKTAATEETEKSQGIHESKPVDSSVACCSTMAEVKQEKTGHGDTVKAMSRVVSRQRKLNADASRLLRRLRRLQCREVNSAVKEKLGQVVTSLGQVLGDRSAVAAIPKSTSKDPLGSRELTALSTAELVSYVQKMQSSQQHSFYSRSAAAHSSHSADLTESPSKLNDTMRLHLRDASGRLTSNMRHLKSALDSDATESSSGGESSDESPPVPTEFPNAASASAAHHKLEWEWTKGRANIVSRWTWLHAQISDLEYRIRQQNDVYKQLRQSKGSISLHDPACHQTGSFEVTGELNGRIKITRSCLGGDANSESRKNSTVVDTSCSTNIVDSGPTDKTSGDSKNARNRVCINSSSVRTAQFGVAEPTPDVGGVQNLDRGGGGGGINSGDKSKDVRVSSSFVAASSSSSMASSSAAPSILASASATASSSSSLPVPSTSSTHLAVPIPSAAVPLSSASVVPSLLYDPSCRAARCMEVRSWRRRTLLKTASLHELSRKASQLSTVSCACYPPVTPCALCGGRYNKVKQAGPQVSARDRTALLEPSYHPVLSFPRDVSLPLQMTECLWKGPNRSESDVRHRLQDEHATKSYRQVSIKNKINSRSHSSDLQHKDETTDRTSAKGIRLIGRPLQSTSLRGRRANLHTMETMRKKKHLSSLARKHLSKTGLRASSLKGSRAQLMRRGTYSGLKDGGLRRMSGRSAFDINNVVIPSHVTSAARVDILQYKEIITPKWREIRRYLKSTTGNGSYTVGVPPATSAASAKRPRLSTSEGDVSKKVHWSSEKVEPSARKYSSSTELFGDETDAEEEIETMSDEAFAARHLRYEIYEKKQCLPTTAGQQRRSRSNRSESDSFTALNPQSPDVTNLLDASASLTSSTLSGVPSTSCLGYSDAEESGHPHFGDSPLIRQHSETRLVGNCATATWILSAASHSCEQLTEPVESRPVPAWPPRTFPLGDLESEQLIAEDDLNSVDPTGKKVKRSASPAVSTSSDSSVPGDEDPNDPEWTVTSRNKDKLGILIKFAKV